VFFGILRFLAGGAAAAVFGLVADRLVVEGFSTVGNTTDHHAQGAAFTYLGAERPVGVYGANARAACDRTRELAGGAGQGGEGHHRFIGRLAASPFTHIRFP
jgi:hypothetical protein